MIDTSLAAPWARHFVPPPAAGLEVCPVCHSAKGLDFAVCMSCNRTASGIPGTVQRIVPVTLWVAGSATATLMHRYKEPHSPRYREMAAVLYQFLSTHIGCLDAGQPFNVVTNVPSKTGRDPHPLGEILRELFQDGYRPLLRLGPGAATIARNNPAGDGFIADTAVAGHRVLLVDDTFTSGATLQSAAIALANAGAEVPTAFVVGRVVRPDFSPESRTLWDDAASQPFEWSRCCATDPPCRAALHTNS